jgi:hypothetical protein
VLPLRPRFHDGQLVGNGVVRQGMEVRRGDA